MPAPTFPLGIGGPGIACSSTAKFGLFSISGVSSRSQFSVGEPITVVPKTVPSAPMFVDDPGVRSLATKVAPTADCNPVTSTSRPITLCVFGMLKLKLRQVSCSDPEVLTLATAYVPIVSSVAFVGFTQGASPMLPGSAMDEAKIG